MPSERQPQQHENTGYRHPVTTGEGEARADVDPKQSVLELQPQKTLTERIYGLGQVAPGRPGKRKRKELRVLSPEN